jgi:D-glycero-alpha-D-manno-heptose-7-phosphate kinase
MGITAGMEIHHDGDLPARTGLGSSSSFTVGLLNALYALKGVMPSKRQLALDAIHVERDIIKENVGSQDQVLAAFGGFNYVSFNGDNDIDVRRITITKERIESLQSHLMLFFTGFSRIASDIAGEQIQQTPNRIQELSRMYDMVDEGISILNGNSDLTDFGKLLHESWQLKRSLTNKITTAEVDEIYDTALGAGAIGGKLLGAGGGGFILFFVKPEDQLKVRESLDRLLYVPFRFEDRGSQIIYYEPEGDPGVSN